MPETPNRLLESVEMRSPELSEIMRTVLGIVASLNPDAGVRVRYGGIVVGDEMIGVFTRKRHVSVEFGNGAALVDNHNVLEGKGKYRRHIVLSSLEDIETKHVQEYVLASLNTADRPGRQ